MWAVLAGLGVLLVRGQDGGQRAHTAPQQAGAGGGGLAGWAWGNTSGLAGGRAGGELDIAALCWPGMPSPGGQHHVPLCYFKTSYLAKGSACLKELPQIFFFFSLLALF